MFKSNQVRMPVHSTPRISVIIPTLNRAILLRRTIVSVLKQTYQNLEIVVVDDCSTDNTGDLVKEFKDRKINYIRHDYTRGGSATRNTGIRIAKGDYIAFLDSDDEWFPEKLEKQVNVLINSPAEIGLVYTRFIRAYNNKKVYNAFYWLNQKEGDVHNTLLDGNYITTSTTLIKKECFSKAGMFDESLPRLQDWECWLRLSKFYHFKCVHEPLVISHQTSDSISTDSRALNEAIDLITKKHFEDFSKNKKSLSRIYCTLGILLCSNNEIKKGRNYLIKAIQLNPLNIKALFVVFATIFGQSAYNKAVESYFKIRSVLKYKAKQVKQ